MVCISTHGEGRSLNQAFAVARVGSGTSPNAEQRRRKRGDGGV